MVPMHRLSTVLLILFSGALTSSTPYINILSQLRTQAYECRSDVTKCHLKIPPGTHTSTIPLKLCPGTHLEGSAARWTSRILMMAPVNSIEILPAAECGLGFDGIVTITNLHIERHGRPINEPHTIGMSIKSKTHGRGVRVIGFGTGFYLHGDAHNEVPPSNVSGSSLMEIESHWNLGDGVWIDGIDANVNRINGIWTQNCRNPILPDCAGYRDTGLLGNTLIAGQGGPNNGWPAHDLNNSSIALGSYCENEGPIPSFLRHPGTGAYGGACLWEGRGAHISGEHHRRLVVYQNDPTALFGTGLKVFINPSNIPNTAIAIYPRNSSAPWLIRAWDPSPRLELSWGFRQTWIAAP